MTLTRAGLEIMAVVSNEEVIERWGILIEKAQGKSNEIFQDTSDFIRDYKAPTLRLKRDRLGASTIGSLLGTKRDFLIISDPRLSSYLVFINARDYGENLDVSWYLTYKPKGSILAMFRPVNFLLNNIDLFAEQDLRAYVTVCHHATLKAVEKLMDRLGQDRSQIKRESKGFLGVT